MNKTYRLTVHPYMDRFPQSFIRYLYQSEEELISVSDAIADMLLFIETIPPDRSNMFIKEMLVDGEWIYLEDDELY